MEAYYYRYVSETKTLEISLMEQNVPNHFLPQNAKIFLNALSTNSPARLVYELFDFHEIVRNIISPLLSDTATHGDFHLDECQRVRFYLSHKTQKIWLAEAYLNYGVSVYFVQSEFKRRIDCRLDMDHYVKELRHWMNCFNCTRIVELLKLFNVNYILSDDLLCLFPNTKDESLYLRCPDRGCVYLYSSLLELRQKDFLDPETNNFYAFINPFKFPSFVPYKTHHLPCIDDSMEMFDVFEITFMDALTRKN